MNTNRKVGRASSLSPTLPGISLEDKLRFTLYNAACDYAGYVFSNRIDYDEAMRVAEKLEDAAENFAAHTAEEIANVKTPMNDERNGNKFEHWALVELMGHQRIAGLVSEQTIAGKGFIRVDVPKENGEIIFTRFFGPDAGLRHKSNGQADCHRAGDQSRSPSGQHLRSHPPWSRTRRLVKAMRATMATMATRKS